MRLNPHEDMTPAELGNAARRTYEAKAYAAGRMKGFPGLTLRQATAAKKFIEAEYLKMMHAGKSPSVPTPAIENVIRQNAEKVSRETASTPSAHDHGERPDHG